MFWEEGRWLHLSLHGLGQEALSNTEGLLRKSRINSGQEEPPAAVYIVLSLICGPGFLATSLLLALIQEAPIPGCPFLA